MYVIINNREPIKSKCPMFGQKFRICILCVVSFESLVEKQLLTYNFCRFISYYITFHNTHNFQRLLVSSELLSIETHVVWSQST